MTPEQKDWIDNASPDDLLYKWHIAKLKDLTWSVRYHETCIKDLEQQIEYHRSKVSERKAQP